MARDSNGNYTLPAGNPVVANELIDEAWANSTMTDIATALQDSLSRSGKGGMLAALRLFAGTVGAPGLAFSTETTSGLWRAGAGDIRLSVLGVEKLRFLAGSIIPNVPVDAKHGADIASAATLDLSAATGNMVHVTGTTTITAVTLTEGQFRMVVFDGVLTLTHHATNNNLPGAANITTAAGDRALYYSDGTVVYCLVYLKANGRAIVEPAGPSGSITTSGYTMNTSRVLGRTTAGVGAPEELTLTQILDLIGSATRGDILYRDASVWARLPAGTLGQVLRAEGPAANPSWKNPITLATQQATTSGKNIDFNSIPAGVRRVVVMFDGVSTNGPNQLWVRIGDSGGLKTSGYTAFTLGGSAGSTGATGASTSAFLMNSVWVNDRPMTGVLVLDLMDSSSNKWAAHGVMNDTVVGWTPSGVVSLSGVLDRLRITTNGGTDDFDLGNVNIQYEF